MIRFPGFRITLLAFLCVLSAGPLARASERTAPADHRPSLALIAVTRGEGFTTGEAGTVEQLILSALHDAGRFRVIGRSDIDTLLNLEAKKQAVGCTDDACMTEIAGALGVDFVAAGDVGRIGTTIVLNLRIIAVHTASVVARAQTAVKSEDDLLLACRQLVDKALTDLGPPEGSLNPAVLKPPLPVETAPEPHLWQRPLAWTLIAVGVAALGAGTGIGISARSLDSQLQGTNHGAGSANVSEKQSSADNQARAADVLFGAGGVLSATGVGLRVAF